ncbi:MAG: hypothetical protein M1156_01725, partial [Candidatus Marsarchaeota archaeon]|nr:hypothetical protein [Candidatus Marsarchaeota archaeon]
MTSITVKKGPDGTRIDFGGIVDLKSMFKFENNDVNKPLIGTNLPFKLLSRGKVRDTYIIAPGVLLMVATDRISTFDVVLNQGIPGKGEVLNKISQFWLAEIERAGIIRTHSIPGKLIIEP